jgi:DNA-binding transcriptional MocR family regulator
VKAIEESEGVRPGGVRAMAIADALEEDIRTGRLAIGAKLPPQREMAARLGLSVGTVSRAYAEARRRGVVEGHVGRGTFVTSSTRQEDGPAETETVDLSLNSPPRSGAVQVIERLLAEIAQDGSLARLMPYTPHQGRPAHRASLGEWLAGHGLPGGSEVMVTQGAQHGIAAALSVLARRGEPLLVEETLFSGAFVAATHMGLEMHGVALDAEGLVPDALDAAFARTGARVLFATPTLQTPTGSVMSEARRDAVAAIVARHDAHLVEDDVYARLVPGLRPIRERIPERTFYVQSFAKYMAPALRVGMLMPPPALVNRTVAALRTTGWMASPILVEVAARAAESGALDEQIEAKRRVALDRRRRARAILRPHLPDAGVEHAGFHLWLPLPEGRSPTTFVSQARDAQVRLQLPLAAGPARPRGVRLCLGSPSDEGLERALRRLARILGSPEEMLAV